MKMENLDRPLSSKARRKSSEPNQLSIHDALVRPHSAMSIFGQSRGKTSVSLRRQKLLMKHRPLSCLGSVSTKDDAPSILIVENLPQINCTSDDLGDNMKCLDIERNCRGTENQKSGIKERIGDVDGCNHSPRSGCSDVETHTSSNQHSDNLKNLKIVRDSQKEESAKDSDGLISCDNSMVSKKTASTLSGKYLSLKTSTVHLSRPRFASVQESSFLSVHQASPVRERASIPSPASSRESFMTGSYCSSENGGYSKERKKRNRRQKRDNASVDEKQDRVTPKNQEGNYGNQRTRHNKAYETFRRVSKTVRVIAGICLALKSYVKEGATKQWSWVEMHLNLRADMEKNLAFDPITFSKLRVTRGSEKLKSILSLKPDKRTKEDIAVVLALLRNTKAFEDYQRETKHELARIMEYQKFEPRRIILKEGHVASCFYIILSGTCLVNKKEMDPRNGETFIRTIDEITSGQSFGEIGLLHDCPRTASVICKNEVEVLLINKEDFIRVVREPLERRREELVQFCRDNHLELNLQDEKVKDNPTAIYTQYYKAGTIVCKDMYSSEYLYVVKSGRCNVIAELSKVKQGAQNNSQNFSIHDDNWKTDAALKRTVHMLNQRESVNRGWSEHARGEFERKDKNMTGTFIINGLQVTTPQLEAEAAAEKAKVLAIPETIFAEEEDPFPTTIPDQPDEELFDSKDGVVRTWKRITVATSMVGKRQRRKSLNYLLTGKAKKIFVQLAQLSEGALFGLESILNAQNVESGVNLSLRSEGGEVILVSKKFFASDANLSKALDAASKTTVEYPSAEKTLGIIQQQRAWVNYKSDVLEQVYTKRREKSF